MRGRNLRQAARSVAVAVAAWAVGAAGHCRRVGRKAQRFAGVFEPWGIVLTLVGVGIALITIFVDLEDRQSERVFRAWQVVRAFETSNEEQANVGAQGSSLREALELLNREFDGFLCIPGVRWVSGLLTGDRRRGCLFPMKRRESLAGLLALGAVLWGSDLRGADLRGADLRDADLRGAYLMEARLKGANLSGAHLVSSRLMDADLDDVDLSNARLIQANLRYSGLKDADLRGAVLFGADLSFTYLTGADLRGADLMYANLSGAGLTEAMLAGADLSEACLSGAYLRNADLTNVDLTNADLTNADLRHTRNLNQGQLDEACGETPLIPAGLVWHSELCVKPSISCASHGEEISAPD